ncbi:hypothetical protein [Dietzia kunjamensis]|uniref:hypothetical protein n=1 Tax=Dietzia kunjamensis TaxID=322509 RepID=UPI00142E6278|nr:hypothetical protein [Dietzia kunjamensis]
MSRRRRRDSPRLPPTRPGAGTGNGNGAHTFALFTRELRDSWRVVGPALGA